MEEGRGGETGRNGKIKNFKKVFKECKSHYENLLHELFSPIIQNLNDMSKQLNEEFKMYVSSNNYNHALSAIRDDVIVNTIKHLIYKIIHCLSLAFAASVVSYEHQKHSLNNTIRTIVDEITSKVSSEMKKQLEVIQMLKDFSPDDFAKLKKLADMMRKLEQEEKEREVDKSYV